MENEWKDGQLFYSSLCKVHVSDHMWRSKIDMTNFNLKVKKH